MEVFGKPGIPGPKLNFSPGRKFPLPSPGLDQIRFTLKSVFLFDILINLNPISEKFSGVIIDQHINLFRYKSVKYDLRQQEKYFEREIKGDRADADP